MDTRELTAYKLNKNKEHCEAEGTYRYYFHDGDKVTLVDVSEEQFDMMFELDHADYLAERRHRTHTADLKSDEYDVDPLENIPSKGNFAEEYCKEYDKNKVVAGFSDDDKVIYEYCIVEGVPQDYVAKMLGRTQGYVAKRLARIKAALETDRLYDGTRDDDEIRVQKQLEKFRNTYRTDDDEDIVWDMFRYMLDDDTQTEIASWFYSFKEYYYYGLRYLILKPYEKYDVLEIGNRVNELPYAYRYAYYEIFDDTLDALEGLFVAMCEEAERRKKFLSGKKPSEVNFQKILDENEKEAARYGMTGSDYYEIVLMPMLAERLGKRYEDYCEKHSEVHVVDENDPRPITEQLKKMFGDGHVPDFKKKRKKKT